MDNVSRIDIIHHYIEEGLAQSIPGARLAILPGDNFVANKNPYGFNETVLRFLQS